MTIEELKDEVEKAGYNVKIDWFGFLGAAFQVIIFEKSISIIKPRTPILTIIRPSNSI